MAQPPCSRCPADLSHYTIEVAESEIPETVRRFDAPGQYQGQAVEYAFAAFGASEGDRGDLYMRRTDLSVSPPALAYYRHR